MSQPIICYRSVLPLAIGASVIAGTESGDFPVSNSWGGNLTNPWVPTTDASGVLSVQIDLPSGDLGWGTSTLDAWPWDGVYGVSALIVGAHRHDPGGFRFDGLAGVVTVEITDATTGAYVLSPQPVVNPINASSYWPITVHDRLPGYVITFRGLTPSTAVSVPQLFLGAALTMPYVDLGFDPYREIAKGSTHEADSGRISRSLLYRRIESNPVWSVVDADALPEIDVFREFLETLPTFWWAWEPTDHPAEIYLVRNLAEVAEYPLIIAAGLRSFSLRLVEAV